MLLTCEEMKRAEQVTFSRGIEAEALMEDAGRGIAEIVRQFHAKPGGCVAYCGKGHNAGDALVAARHLSQWGWKIELRLAFAEADLAPLTAKKLKEFRDDEWMNHRVFRSGGSVILDGLLGLGANGALRSPLAELVEEINAARRLGAWVLAIDLPSGLNGDTGEPGSPCVQADLTATIACVKKGLVADVATGHVGRLAVVPLPELQGATGDAWEVSTSWDLREGFPARSFEMHKGQAGRVGIIAGSPGFLGAARLCSAAGVRGGAGLVTLFTKPEFHAQLATSCAPEVMVREVKNYREVLEENLDVLAVGPGLGKGNASEILSLIRDVTQPMVVDADALNILSHDMALLKRCQGPRLLTPHPGEMARLFAQLGRWRPHWAEDFAKEFPVTLLLKGARTVITQKGVPGFYNTTGNPGMASGGMGDVLTGVCAALIAQMKDKPLAQSAVLGAWLCGRAAEVAVFGPGGSPESLCASDILTHLGAAFSDLRAGVY